MDLGSKPQLRQGFRKLQLDAQEKAWREGADEAGQSVEDVVQRFETDQMN